MIHDAKYLEVAGHLGMRLCREAIWSGDECNWTGDSMEFVNSRWQVINRLCGPDLYSGTPGITLFLANLYACTKNEIFKRTAIGGLVHTLSQLNRPDAVTGFGFYSGLTGLAYVAAEAGEIFGEDELVEFALEFFKNLSDQEPPSSQSWDVVSGSAGVIPVLLKLHQRYGKGFLLDYAIRHGDCLVQAAHRGREGEGWSWTTVSDLASRDLTGFSHGAAGIAWALLELHQQARTEDMRFRHAAQQALHYERRWFDPKQENWPDFRSQDQPSGPAYAAAWCHGAPGIGLSRLRCYQLLQDQECLADAQAALRTTSRFLMMAADEGNYSLCHGHCGNAELLMMAGDLLGDAESLKAVEQLADRAMEKHHGSGNPWPCGVLQGGETPNLMLGLAGIGYFYLRLYDRKVPSVLMVGPT